MDTVKDIMTPIESLPSIHPDACLLDAAQALKKSAENAPVPLLVSVRESDRFLGILNMVALLRGLSPKYREEGLFASLEHKGMKKDFMRLFLENFDACPEPLQCRVAAASSITVREVLRAPSHEESIEVSHSAEVAIDLMVLGKRDYMYVTGKDEVVGVIDAASIFDSLFARSRECAHTPASP